MAPDKFTIRRLPDGEAGVKHNLDTAELALGARLRTLTAPFEVKVDDKPQVQNARGLGVLNRVDDAFREKNASRIVVRPASGAAYAIKRIEAPTPVPVIDTPGTRPIDRIYSALHQKFDAEFDVRDMGICVSKPGEHGHCNAYDAGTTVGASVTVVRERLTKMASFLREQGLLNDQDPTKGLPVNGVIFLDSFWRTGMPRTWGDYTGTFHAIHIHVSGKPSFTGNV